MNVRMRRWFSALGLILILLAEVTRPMMVASATAAAGSTTLSGKQQSRGQEVIEIQASAFDLPPAEDEAARPYPKPSVLLQEGESVSFTIELPAAGQYNLFFDMTAVEAFINPPEGQLRVDGDFPNEAARRIVFPLYYENTTGQFPLDRYGNQALIRQKRLVRWSKAAMYDADFSQPYPVVLDLAAGEHTFEFTVTRESMLLGSVYLEPFAEYPAYEQYLAENEAADSSGFFLEIEAEQPTFKNDTAVRPASFRSLEVTPYDTYKLMMNTLGGETWKRSGSAVYYRFSVPADGLYMITLRALQNTKNNFTVFRRITIDGEPPFSEVNAVPFTSSSRWENLALGGETPYRFYLAKGEHLLGIEATNAPYQSAIEKIQQALVDINNLALEIKKLTGNQTDPFKEWVISDYIPDLEEQLRAIAGNLQTDMQALTAINQSGGSQEILSYQMAIDNIVFLADDPDKIPARMNRFSEGTRSAAQLLAKILPSLQEQPLALDKIYIHSPDCLPHPVDVPVMTSLTDGLKRFIHSFRKDPYQSIGAGAGEIEVWVNRPRQYVDLLQSLADERFTPETGISVKFSIMPNESKLVLANAADIEPDVALGVSTNVPYELAVRNALYDLRSFPDFDSFIRIYSPGALLSYIIDDSVYAIPETQDFWVTFYRRDILNSLGIPIPDTWQEVIEILPELQRYGMNYNTPLSTGSGGKNLLLTAPYVFNYGAQLYSDNGYATGLDSDEAISALKFMAESFTIYGMPLTTSSFYDSFRYGSIPIGISNFTDYIKLLTAAPEIAGLWEIDLYPATILPDGRELRYATGSAQACIMFAETDRPAEAWEFMKWWMSTETQVDFQQQIILNYGIEYLWNSANLESMAASPIPDEHKRVILEQWQWLQEPVKLPGSYMQERELSNAWNRIVFDGIHPRIAIDESVIIINREIARKMEEFGYIQDGVRTRELKIPTIETVEAWMQNGSD